VDGEVTKLGIYTLSRRDGSKRFVGIFEGSGIDHLAIYRCEE